MNWDDLADKYDGKFYYVEGKDNWEIYDSTNDEFVSEIDPDKLTPNYLHNVISKYIIDKRNKSIKEILCLKN